MNVTRREYLKIIGSIAASSAVLIAANRMPGGEALFREVSAAEVQTLKIEAEEEKIFIAGSGLSGAGRTGNMMKVYVKNGRIIRSTPLDFTYQYNPSDFNYDAWVMEARGKVFQPPHRAYMYAPLLAYKKRAYSPNRVKYPLKRVDWSPEARHPENRGKSGYVRISWDEALNIITSEMKRIIETYGVYGVLVQWGVHGQSLTLHSHVTKNTDLMLLLGGCTFEGRNPDSWEGYWWGAKHVWGDGLAGHMMPQNNLLYDILTNSDLLLFWGADPETTPYGFGTGGSSTVPCMWFREAGIKSYYVSPDYNFGAAVYADKWIPVLPNTDAALQLAIAYTWITEGTYDKAYVSTHTFGFEEFKKYVLGEDDGVPKTPDWAASICGVPSARIKALAREWASKRTTIVHNFGGAAMRGPYSHEYARLEACLLAMQGLGKPGVTQTCIYLMGKPGMEFVPDTVSYAREWTMAGFPIPSTLQCIPKALLPEAILNPPISWYGGPTTIMTPVEQQFVKWEYPQAGKSEAHMIWDASCCYITCLNDGNRMIEAYRSPKIEFFLTQHPWIENNCLLSDLILPVTTIFEVDDIATNNDIFSVIHFNSKCIEPIGESKSDYEIGCMIAEKLGPAVGVPDLLEKYSQGMTIEERLKDMFEGSGLSKVTTWDEFKAKQYWIAKVDRNWKSVSPGMRFYYDMPEGQGLHTKSGKLEFYAQWLAENFPDDDERGPVPHYIPYGETHQESQSHPRAKMYPLLVISNHPRWRAMHANTDDISWIREIETAKVKGQDGYLYEPLWINPKDANTRDIRTGDIVQVYNEKGIVLGGAYVTERIIPGAVYMDHGAKYDPISVEDKIDRGGDINLICPHGRASRNTAGMVVSGYLVEVQKADMESLRSKYPEAFKRPMDPAYGPDYNSWVVGG